MRYIVEGLGIDMEHFKSAPLSLHRLAQTLRKKEQGSGTSIHYEVWHH